MPAVPALTPAQTEEAAQLYAFHDWPASDIAEHFGVSKTAVQNALVRAGSRLRAAEPEKAIRVKQCAKCLHFLPVGAFYLGGPPHRRRLESWCNDCKNHPLPKPWDANPAPLAQALTNWRPLC